MQVRRLNEQGINGFQALLREARDGEVSGEARMELLESRRTSPQGLNVAVLVDSSIQFETKFELAKYLGRKLSPVESAALSRDRGLWAWLALFFFDILCPRIDGGARRVYRDSYYYIPSEDFQTYFRHLLYTPFVIYNSFQGSLGKSLLTGPPHIWGDLNEQIAARQEFISCGPVLGVIDHLYYECSNGVGQVKRGATSRNRNGSLRRLITFLQQIDATYDLYGMSTQKILDILPSEFNEWR